MTTTKVDTDTPLVQHHEGKEPIGARTSSSRGSSGKKVDLSHVDDGPIIERC